VGIPKIYEHGVEGEYYFLVLELLSENLEQTKEKFGGKLSLKTILLIANQLVFYKK